MFLLDFGGQEYRRRRTFDREAMLRVAEAYRQHGEHAGRRWSVRVYRTEDGVAIEQVLHLRPDHEPVLSDNYTTGTISYTPIYTSATTRYEWLRMPSTWNYTITYA